PDGKVLWSGLPQLSNSAASEAKAGTVSRTPDGGSSTTAAERMAGNSQVPSARSGWVSLFNGSDLTGWKTHPSQPGNWRVKDGILIGSGPDVSHLYSARGDFRDFLLLVEARINAAGNSGVLGRASFGPSDRAKWPLGYEAAIQGNREAPMATGSL